jgi:hypothetical protein
VYEFINKDACYNFESIHFFWVDAEKAPELVKKFGITTAPMFLLYHPDRDEYELYERPDIEHLTDGFKTLNSYYSK